MLATEAEHKETDVTDRPAQVEGEGASPEKKRPRRRGRVTVFHNWCKGCGLCIAFCPNSVFEPGSDGHPLAAHEDKCTVCNWCVVHCPDFAIVVEEVDEDTPHSVGSANRREVRR